MLIMIVPFNIIGTLGMIQFFLLRLESNIISIIWSDGLDVCHLYAIHMHIMLHDVRHYNYFLATVSAINKVIIHKSMHHTVCLLIVY